jgi:hypothetical protein
MITELMEYINSEGFVLVENPSLLAKPTVRADSSEKVEPLYKEWWFWTAIGVGVAGLGAGGYFLLKPGDNLKFSVNKQ